MGSSVRGLGGGRIVVTLPEVETAVLEQLLRELLALLGSADDGAVDPLSAAVGIGTATTLPDDPVLARLFPDGYRDDPAAAADFRRYTELGLRARKRAAAQTMLDTLDSDPGERTLESEQAQAWLLALNDLRLALGERLGVTEDYGEEEPAPDEPDAYAYAVYDLLTFLQDALVKALD